ncbi:MAG: lipoprotein insertase outer membrane protein LolB [Trichlorobacter sp.]|nr:lipoprotein insertase outer membrane protein LolB [Trichlorobacter sp.]
MKHNLYILLLLLTIAFSGGCSTIKPEVLDLAQLDHKATLHSLTADLDISFKSKKKSGSARGMMVYKQPDLYRFVLLSPFGNTLMEAALAGNQLTLVYPSKKVAFSGDVNTLPPGVGHEAWKLLPWMFEQQSLPGLTISQQTTAGTTTLFYDNGLASEKKNSQGDGISYADYAVLKGLAVATTYEFVTSGKEWVRLRLHDPEINPELDLSVFSPNLKGLWVLPLAMLPKE